MRSSAALPVLFLALSSSRCLFCRWLASRCATRRRQCHRLEGRLSEMGSRVAARASRSEFVERQREKRKRMAELSMPGPFFLPSVFTSISHPVLCSRCGCRFIHWFRSLLFPSPAELASSLLLHPRPSHTATCRAQASIQVSTLSRERLETGCRLFYGVRFMRAAFDRVRSAMV